MIVCAAVAACAGRGPVLPPVTTVTPSPRWEEVFTCTEGWTGADGAATVALPGNRLLWLFGDSFIGRVVEGKHAAGTKMVNNTVGVTPVDTEPPDRMSFFWGGTGQTLEAWARPTQQDEWFWPASGGVLAPGPDGKECLVLFMSRISRRDGGESVWNFRARGTTALIVSNPAHEIEQWKTSQTTLTTLVDGGRVLMWGTGAAAVPGKDGPEVLILGIDETNVMDKRLVEARAPAKTVEKFETWRFRTAEGWSERESDAAATAEGLSSEISLHRMNVRGKDCLVVVYSEAMLGRGIMVRVRAFPDGAWSEPVRLYDCPEPLEDRRMMAYSAKAHPEISRSGELLVSYSVNSTDFGDVLSHAEKYRPRFVRVPVSMLPGAP